MEKEKIQEFTFRVTQASRSELIVIMYDVILTDLAEAKKKLAENNREEYTGAVKHAARFLNELIGSLDYRYELSFQLLSLYSFANKTLVRAMFRFDDSLLEPVVSMMEKLRDSFREVSKADTTGPMMQNTEKVYAGLTYGKNSLNESLLDAGGAKRGFMA